MGAAPFWKVYTKEGVYEAACKSPEIAAAVVSVLGDGATIRFDHSPKCVAWTEGKENDGEAFESYDECAIVCLDRLEAFRVEMRKRREEQAKKYTDKVTLREVVEKITS